MATYPDNYLAANYAHSKTPNVVFLIDGVATPFTLAKAFQGFPRYGDPIDYGDPGLFYGVPYIVGNQKSYLSTESSLAITQKIEPEQGRGSTAEITIVLIDRNKEISELIAPGKIVPDILGRECSLLLGYQNTSYPEDYFVVFRGYITNTTAQAGKIRLTVSDATQKKRQGAFYAYRSTTFLPITANSQAVFLSSFSGIPTDIKNIKDAYDPALNLYLKISNEFIKLDRNWPFYLGDFNYKALQINERGSRDTVAENYSPFRLKNPFVETVSFTAGTNLVTLTAHGLLDNQVVAFTEIVNTTGVDPGVLYYVISATANTFQLSNSPSGPAITLVTNGNGKLEREWIDWQLVIGPTTYNLSASIPQLDYLLGDWEIPGSFNYYVTENMNRAMAAQLLPSIMAVQLYYSRQGDALNGFDPLSYVMTFTNGKPNEYKFVITSRNKNGPSYPTTLRFSSGANASKTIAETLGFTPFDKTGAQTYAGENFLKVDAKDVSAAVEIIDHPMNVALSVMLSGWNGPFISDVSCTGIGTADGTTLNGAAILLPLNIDAKQNFGLTAGLGSSTNVTKLGDLVIISGSTDSNNNREWVITDIVAGPDNDNQVLIVAPRNGIGALTFDNSLSIRLAFRSKYDRLPPEYGLKLAPKFVDVDTHEFLRDVYLADSGYQIAALIQNQQAGKEFIESQCYFPFGCYAVTKFGKLSVTLTKPPLAGLDTVELNASNILNPQNIVVTRGLNNRRFFNQIQYQYDKTDSGKYLSVYRAVDTDSLNVIGIQSILPINSDGIKTSINGVLTGSENVVESVSNAFLNRFAQAAFEIRLAVNLEAGARIEAGDIVRIVDDGSLGITNLADGTRTLGTTLMEVIDRSLDVKAGQCALTLLSSVGFLASDRFGIIAPSSRVDIGGTSQAPTSSSFGVLPSFGAVFGDLEYKKWVPFVGQRVVVYSEDWSVSGESVISAVDVPSLSNQYGRVTLDPALSFTPAANYYMTIADYNTSTNPALDAYSKVTHAFLDPTVLVASGISERQFMVALADVGVFNEASAIYIHSEDYSLNSPIVKILTVDAGTGTITVNNDLGFTPAAGHFIELIGFPDKGAGYMWS